MSELLTSANKAIDLALKFGADDAWAITSQNRVIDSSMSNGELEKIEDSTSQALRLKLFCNGRYSVHSSTDLKEERLKRFIKEAVSLTQLLEPDKDREITPKHYFINAKNADLKLWDEKISALSSGDRIALLKTMDEHLTMHPKINVRSCAVSTNEYRFASVSSNGFSYQNRQNNVSCYAEANLLANNNQRSRGSMYNYTNQLLKLDSSSSLAKMALTRAASFIGAEKVKSQVSNLVLDARAASSLISHLIRGAYARSVANKQSIWPELLNKHAFSKAFTLYDDPSIVSGLGSRHYDNNGVSAKPFFLVDAGQVKNIYVDPYYGKKISRVPTASSMSNLLVQPGRQSQQQLIKDAGNGMFITSWLGGNSDSTNGDFSIGFKGFLIKNGELVQPVTEMNMNGNLKTVFAQLAAVGNDTWQHNHLLSPSLLFEGINFSGV